MDKDDYKIAIVGAGAVGGILAAYLTEKGFDVETVCKYPDAVKACREGLKISGVRGSRRVPLKTVLTPEYLSGPKDAILIATKAYDLAKTAKECLPYLKQGGIMLSMQNGICTDILAGIAGENASVGCVITYAATQIDRGHMELTGEGGLIIGYPHGRRDGKLETLAYVLNEAFPTAISDDIVSELYTKLIVNAGIAALGVLTGMPLGVLLKIRLARRVFTRAVREAVSAADANGVALKKFAGKVNYYFFVRRNPISAVFRNLVYSSMGKRYSGLVSSSYQSFLRGRPTEVDFLNGEVVRYADKAGVPAPVNKRIIAMVKEVERGEREIAVKNLKEILQYGEK